MQNAITHLGYSVQVFDRILKIAHTISDLEGQENITSDHISEVSNTILRIENTGADSIKLYNLIP